MAEKAANFERWYWIDRKLLREFRACKPSILHGLNARLAERWHVVSHFSRSATWLVGAPPAEVTLKCNSQRDGNKFCILKTAKAEEGRPLFDSLCSRLLQRGAKLTHDSEAPAPKKEGDDAEIKEHAMHMLMCLFDRTLDCKRSEFKSFDAQTFAAVRNFAPDNVRWPGWSENSHQRTVELAATIDYEQFFEYLYANATYDKRNKRVCYYKLVSPDGADGYCKILDRESRTGTVCRYRLSFDHALRGLHRWLSIRAVQKRSSIAWNLNMALFLDPECSLSAWVQHLSFVLRGWHLTEHTKSKRRELRRKLAAMKRDWSR